MRITVYPHEKTRAGRFVLIPPRYETSFKFSITEETADGTREKDFWLKAWRLRRAMQFFVNTMWPIAFGTGIIMIPIPRNLSEEKLQAIRKAVEELWD